MRQLNLLQQKGCIEIGNTNREGTLYNIILPNNIPIVIDKQSTKNNKKDDDFFNDHDKRKLIYESDQWTCQYCGDKVTLENITLDHFIPKSKGGQNNKENLRTCCLMCNSIKSGKTFKEAAPYLLKSIKERRQKS